MRKLLFCLAVPALLICCQHPAIHSSSKKSADTRDTTSVFDSIVYQINDTEKCKLEIAGLKSKEQQVRDSLKSSMEETIQLRAQIESMAKQQKRFDSIAQSNLNLRNVIKHQDQIIKGLQKKK